LLFCQGVEDDNSANFSQKKEPGTGLALEDTSEGAVSEGRSDEPADLGDLPPLGESALDRLARVVVGGVGDEQPAGGGDDRDAEPCDEGDLARALGEGKGSAAERNGTFHRASSGEAGGYTRFVPVSTVLFLVDNFVVQPGPQEYHKYINS